MGHIVLLGDSIFDNARYVPGGPSVIEHLHRCVPKPWQATLLASDGAIAEDVLHQVRHVPSDATHLVVSAGGNNALSNSGLILRETADSFVQVLTQLAEVWTEFANEYRTMLERVLEFGKPTVVCTVYDAIPDLAPAERMGLSFFNEAILRQAFRLGVSVLDLRLLCRERADYAATSPIEPSVYGGGKIARAIWRIVKDHDFTTPGSRVFVS